MCAGITITNSFSWAVISYPSGRVPANVRARILAASDPVARGARTPFPIVRNDISLMSADVIVSAANEHPLAGGGVRGAIFKAAGPAKLIAACEAVAPCPAGRTVSTPAFGLSARRIVHAVGPRLIDGAHDEEAPLRSTDASTLAGPARLGAQSVSPPPISAGIFGYPPAAAPRAARKTD